MGIPAGEHKVDCTADRIAVMYKGKIVEEAEVDHLISNPQHPYTKSLLAAIAEYDPERKHNLGEGG
jgi:ABC-type dipeptide/oligopeptide/nickel transport system ATPase component